MLPGSKGLKRGGEDRAVGTETKGMKLNKKDMEEPESSEDVFK